MTTQVQLKIADTIIQMRSRFPLRKLSEQEHKSIVSERFDNFFYKGGKAPDIVIDIEVIDKLPDFSGRDIFITRHFQSGSENWRLVKAVAGYVYKSPLESKQQVIVVNGAFNNARAYLKNNKGYGWSASDIIYDFLQVLLINYFAQRKNGIFTHSVGIKDVDGRGLLFNGKSGAGKSTTARLWHNNSRAMVLNDDRIIIRKAGKHFFIYGSPWHGEFSDYLESHIESAPLNKIFFIHHSQKNNARTISQKAAFNLLYPALFPTFWDKDCLENIAGFSFDVIKNTPCYRLGFVHNKDVIDFIRGV